MFHPEDAMLLLRVEQERIDLANERRRIHLERTAGRSTPAESPARRRTQRGLLLRLGRAQ